LINHAFGIGDPAKGAVKPPVTLLLVTKLMLFLQNVAHGKRGEAEIRREILSDDNNRFVLHDSRGFEGGEVDNFKLVEEFIKERMRMPQLKDKLHAVWYGSRSFFVNELFDAPVAGYALQHHSRAVVSSKLAPRPFLP
jgi:hypothetical protein